jgi:hypothetical protein
LVLLSMLVAAPSAVAAQGCTGFPSFCAWDQPFMQGNVRNLSDPKPSPLLSLLLGGPICYDLNVPRRSFVNDTGYTAALYADPNCTILLSTVIPRGFANDAAQFGSVRFLPT